MFHIFPHDVNETFGPGGGRGMGDGRPDGAPGRPGDRRTPGAPAALVRRRTGPGGRGGGMMMGGGRTSIRSSAWTTPRKPLRSKLLAVPALRARYMTYVQQIAAKWLDWNTLGPLTQQLSGA